MVKEISLPIPNPKAIATQLSLFWHAKARIIHPAGAMNIPGINERRRCSGRISPLLLLTMYVVMMSDIYPPPKQATTKPITAAISIRPISLDENLYGGGMRRVDIVNLERRIT